MSAMNGYLDEIGEIDEVGQAGVADEIDEIDEFDDDELDNKDYEASSNVGEISVEINIEDLIAEIEADRPPRPISVEKSARKRLEELLEERRAARELGEDDEFDLI